MIASHNTSEKSGKNCRSFARMLSLASVAVIAVTLGGCRGWEDPTRVAGWSLIDPSQRHPIMVSQQPTTLNIVVPRGSDGLNPSQKAEVLHFARKAHSSESGRLAIAVPGGSENEGAAINAAEDIRDLLVKNGMSEGAVSIEGYHDSDPYAPVRLSYVGYVAEGPTCANWSENLARNPKNLPHPDLGCATQRNLAAMVANPEDLLGPRRSTARVGDRRDVVWEQYVKGEPMGSQRSEDERASIKGSN